jgi:hypothetical protein
MKKISLYSLIVAWLLSSCNRGVFITIDNKKYDYGKNTVVAFQDFSGTTPGYGINIKSFRKSDSDSSFFLFGAGRSNMPITAGNYSFPQSDRTNLPASSITFYDNKGNIYHSGGDEVYGTTFIITSLTKKRVKGWFKASLGDEKEDSSTLENSLNVEGHFNVSLKNAKYKSGRSF